MPGNSQLSQHLQVIEAQSQGAQSLALFDLDKTLILGHSIFALFWEYLRGGQADMKRVVRELVKHYDLSVERRHYSAWFRHLVATLEGTQESALEALGQRAFEHSIAASLYREARLLVDHHRALGHHVAIVSAATRYQIEPVARLLGIDTVYCSELQVVNGCFTGRLHGRLCLGETKAQRARQFARLTGASLQDSWFYSDSQDDLPLLRKVGHPVATNPSSTLAEIAQRHGWQQLEFCSRGKANIESLLRTALTANSVITAAAAGAATWVLSRSTDRAVNSMTEWLGGVGVAAAGIELEISGTEHLEAVRPAIFTFNHQSYLDSLVMAHLLRHDFVAFIKREAGDNRLLGPLLKAHGTIFVDREAQDQSLCVSRACEALQAGKSLLIAPEGTRSATGNLQPFKPGAFLLARKAGVPIVPVVLHNVADALPKGRFLIRPASIQVTVLPPIAPADIGNVRRASAALRHAYAEALQRVAA